MRCGALGIGRRDHLQQGAVTRESRLPKPLLTIAALPYRRRYRPASISHHPFFPTLLFLIPSPQLKTANMERSKMERHSELPQPVDLSHHLSRNARSREPSSMKQFYKYFAIPGIGQLAGGHSSPALPLFLLLLTPEQVFPMINTSLTTTSRPASRCLTASSPRPTSLSTLLPTSLLRLRSQMPRTLPVSLSLTPQELPTRCGRLTWTLPCSMALPRATRPSINLSASSPPKICTPMSLTVAVPRSSSPAAPPMASPRLSRH